MGFWQDLFGHKSESPAKVTSSTNIPPTSAIPDTVTLILAFMPDLSAAKKVFERLPSPEEVGSPLKLLGGPTKQGRQQVQIHGRISKTLK